MSDFPYGLGWIPEKEHQHTTAIAPLMRPLCMAAGEIPKQVCLRRYLKPEFQGEIGQCAGAAVSLAMQGDTMIQEGLPNAPRLNDLSMTFAWLAGRRKDGTSEAAGIDTGTTIQGVCVAAAEYGMATEAEFPTVTTGQAFRARGGASVPPGIWKTVQRRRVRAVAFCGDAVTGAQAMGTGQGFVVFGVDWNSDWANHSGSGPITKIPGGRVLGGHAIAAMGYEITAAGELYWDVWNHHGPQWGDGGQAFVHSRVIDYLLRSSNFGARIVTGSAAFQVRPFQNWKGVIG